MKPEEIRIAIAEACGYRDFGFVDSIINPGKQELTCTITPTSEQFAIYCVPDYLNDLNACHEMEKALSQHQRDQYLLQLNKVCDDTLVVSATAPQRCEAFLRTLGLWKE